MLDIPGFTALVCRKGVWPGVGPSRWLDAVERVHVDPYPWLLESSLVDPRLGRYSFAGADPYAVVRAWGTSVEVECRRASRPGWTPGRHRVECDPLEALRSWLPPRPAAPDAVRFPFAGGAVGFLGYALAERVEPVRLHGRDDLGLPDLALLFVDRLIAFDHRREELRVIGVGYGDDLRSAERAAARSADALCGRMEAPRGSSRPLRMRGAPSPANPIDRFDQSDHAKAVDRISEEIEAGNVYQACLTYRIERDWVGDAWSLYRRLRRLNPAPFASFFELPEAAIVTSSPERFLRLSSDRGVECRPIKGTYPRHDHPAEDDRRRRRLSQSEKDRAENLMIVDLTRNDLGRVCETGSIEVPELFAIEDYASVFQMVSTVRGRLRPDCDAVDLLRATFPPGSMTGAPKLAAMRILDRLEPVHRGIYSGAIGYLDVRGGADFSVVIRSILLRDGRAYVHTGGAIVADSDPASEWRETLDKVRPLLAALEADGSEIEPR